MQTVNVMLAGVWAFAIIWLVGMLWLGGDLLVSLFIFFVAIAISVGAVATARQTQKVGA